MLSNFTTINNKKYTLKELSEKFNINIKTLEFRYQNGKRGKDLIRPVEHCKHIIFNDKKVSFQQLAKKNNLNVSTVRNRYYKQNDRGDDLIRPKGTSSSKHKSNKDLIYDKLRQNSDITLILNKVEAKQDLTDEERIIYWRAYRREYGRLYRQRNKKEMPKYWKKYYHEHNRYKRKERVYHKNGQSLTRHAMYFNNYYYGGLNHRAHVNAAVKNYRQHKRPKNMNKKLK